MLLLTGPCGKDRLSLPDHRLSTGFDGLKLLFIHGLERCNVLFKEFPRQIPPPCFLYHYRRLVSGQFL